MRALDQLIRQKYIPVKGEFLLITFAKTARCPLTSAITMAGWYSWVNKRSHTEHVDNNSYYSPVMSRINLFRRDHSMDFRSKCRAAG